LIQHFTVKGFDVKNNSSNPILGGSYGNYLSFESKTYSFSTNFIFTNQKQNAGIGIGPALVYSQLKRAFDSEDKNNHTYSKNYSLPGVSFTCFWNFVDTKWLTFRIRNNMFFYAPAKI